MKRFQFLVLLLCLCGVEVGAQQGGDLQARILYAFYVEDTNQLTSIVQELAMQMAANGGTNTQRYHLAHAHYRLGLLAAESRGPAAAAAFSECVDELKPVVDQEVDAVEALAMQSACYSRLARLRRLQAALLRSRADDRMRRAMRSAPRNPRVELLRTEAELIRAEADPAAATRAVDQLLRAAQVFDLASTTSIDAPGWGQAETYLQLGRLLGLRGDFLGARNFLERALIVAPDYKAAQRQLAVLKRR